MTALGSAPANTELTDSFLASPNNGLPKLLFQSTTRYPASGNYNTGGADYPMSENGLGLTGAIPAGFIWQAATFVIPGKTNRFVQRAWMKTPAGPGVNLELGLKELGGAPPAAVGSFIGSTHAAVGPGAVNSLVLNVTNDAPSGGPIVYGPVLRLSGGGGSLANDIWISYQLFLIHV